MDHAFDTADPQRITFSCGALLIEVLGGVDLSSKSALKVTLKASALDEPARSVHDTLNLFVHGQAEGFVQRVAARLSMTNDVVRDGLDILMNLLEKYRLEKSRGELDRNIPVRMPSGEEREALDYLRAPDLMERVNEDLGRIGLVGEVLNRQLAFLTMTSRKLAFPLHLVNFGRTGTGKSSLLEIISQCMPEEDCLELTSTSEKAFYHFSELGLQHKLLLLQDLFGVSDEILFQIRELQSKRKLTRVITLKDKNGNFQSTLKTVHGPVCVVASTTARSVFAENANRAIEVVMNESSEQDALVLERQRLLAAGAIDVAEEDRTKKRLSAVQRLLQPLPVKNPFALELSLPKEVQHQRRSNAIYLGLIEVITLLHQHQRQRELGPDGREHVVSQAEDIAIANALMTEVLVQKADLLTQATRRFFEALKAWAKEEGLSQFTQREVSTGMRVHASRTKRYFAELLDYGHVSIVGGDRFKKGYLYSPTDGSEYARLHERIKAGLHSVTKARDTSKRSSGPSVVRSRTGPLKPVKMK